MFGVARINAGEVVLNPPGDYVVGCKGASRPEHSVPASCCTVRLRCTVGKLNLLVAVASLSCTL